MNKIIKWIRQHKMPTFWILLKTHSETLLRDHFTHCSVCRAGDYRGVIRQDLEVTVNQKTVGFP